MKSPSVFTVVLAAGQASRFGKTKQLENYAGLPLVTRAVRLAQTISGANSVLVVGHDWQDVTDICAPLAGFFVLNPYYADGLATSIEAAIRSIADIADAVLLLLADQPLITSDHCHALIQAWRASPEAIVSSAFADTVGPPVIFPQRDFAALMSLKGDSGARSIIRANAERAISINFAPAALDIDRRSDLRGNY